MKRQYRLQRQIAEGRKRMLSEIPLDQRPGRRPMRSGRPPLLGPFPERDLSGPGIEIRPLSEIDGYLAGVSLCITLTVERLRPALTLVVAPPSFVPAAGKPGHTRHLNPTPRLSFRAEASLLQVSRVHDSATLAPG